MFSFPLSLARLASFGVAAIALMAVFAAPASAARSYQQPQGFHCENALVKVSPPRVWASGNVPEQVLWTLRVDWYNGSQWVHHRTTHSWSTFNYYGQSLTSWSGGRFVNSRYNVPVSYRGYYRVSSHLSAPGVNSAVWVAGGNYCWMP